MKLPLAELPAPSDAAFPKRKSIKRPVVGLLLEREGNQMIVFALIDSGADSCIFPASMAERLGISIPNKNPSSFTGPKNQAQVAYYEHIQATILTMEAPDIDCDQQPVTFPLYAGFCDTLEHIGMGLLGQEGFFSQFAVNFNRRLNYFQIL